MTDLQPWTTSQPATVLGTGCALPGQPVSTEALIELVSSRFAIDCAREARAVAARMAITARHVCRDFAAANEPARPGHNNAELVAAAITSALADAGLGIDDVGYLIAHTTTPLQPLPPNVALAADLLGYRGPHVELRQACTGFANALMIASGLLAAPGAKPVVLVGSETGSLFFDPSRLAEDRGQIVNMVQMGDGAGAIVLGPHRAGTSALEASWMGSIGLGRVPGFQQFSGQSEFAHDFTAILQSGSQIFDAGAATAASLGHAVEAADIVIPHQISGQIGVMAARHFSLPREHFFVNADRVGNTGSAAIWIALAQLRAAQPAPGTKVLALGAEASKYMYGGFAYVHA